MRDLGRTGTLFLILTVFMICNNAPGQASWVEGEVEILSLDECLLLLSANLGLNVESELAGSTPIIFPANLQVDNPKALPVALIQSGLSLREFDQGRVKIVLAKQSPLQGAELRRRPVAPMALSSKTFGAINSGGALLYGEIVEPPFLVEVTSDEILINGVTVFPSIGLPEPIPDAATEDLFAMTNRACNDFENDRTTRGDAVARLNLQQTMVDHPAIDEAQWLSDDRLQLQKSDGSEETMVFNREGRDADPPTPADRDADLMATAEDLRQALNLDFTICAGTTYLLSAPERGSEVLRNRLQEIISSGDSDELKLLRLQARTGHRHAAADLLYTR